LSRVGAGSFGANRSVGRVQVSPSRAVVKIGATAVTTSIGSVVRVTNGSGLRIATSNGIAGSLSAAVTFTLPAGVAIVATSFKVEFNTTSVAVSESMNVA